MSNHACELSGYAPGIGDPHAEIMLVAEALDETEELLGEPMVGRSGQRLNALIDTTFGLERSDVWITNVVKHRPPDNRDPTKKEINDCIEYLWQEIQQVQPRIIVTLGRIALREIAPQLKLSADHGKAFNISVAGHDCIVVPWYHPAYALRSGEGETTVVEDAANFNEAIELLGSNVAVGTYRLATLEQADEYCAGASRFAFDLETTSVKTGKYQDFPDIVGWSVANGDADTAALYHASGEFGDVVQHSLRSDDVEVICHNTKFEYGRLRALGVTLRNYEDTKIAAYLLGYPSTHLKHLTRQELGIDPITYEQATQGRDMGDLTPEEILAYAAADPDHTLMLWQQVLLLWQQLVTPQ